MPPSDDANDRQEIGADPRALISYLLKGRTVFVGVGNILRGDDGFGPALVAELRGQVEAVCIDAGTAPENYLGAVARERPDIILFLDAADLGLAPGQWAVLGKDEIVQAGLTTHDISPGLLMEYLDETTHAAIYLLAVQPEDTRFGSGLSEVVSDTVRELSAWLRQSAPRRAS